MIGLASKQVQYNYLKLEFIHELQEFWGILD